MKRIARAYLDYSRIQIAYYDQLDRKVVGRDASAIMLLHLNRLNAATMWGYCWARERHVKIDGRLEQEPPAWISASVGDAAK